MSNVIFSDMLDVNNRVTKQSALRLIHYTFLSYLKLLVIM